MQRRQETETDLWCGACREMHPKARFTRAAASPSGFNYACKSVATTRNRRSHLRRRDELNTRHIAARLARKASPEYRIWAAKKMLSEARRRARQRGFEFSISLNDLTFPDVCPVFGWALDYRAADARRSESASLDRIDSRKGYTPDNVWIISWRANRLKADATIDELHTILLALEFRVGKKTAGRLLDGKEHNEFPRVIDSSVSQSGLSFHENKTAEATPS